MNKYSIQKLSKFNWTYFLKIEALTNVAVIIYAHLTDKIDINIV